MRKIQLKEWFTNPWAASLIQKGRNILPRAPIIHITEQQSPMDLSVIFPIMMMKKCKIIYSGSEILSFFFLDPKRTIINTVYGNTPLFFLSTRRG